PASHRKFTMRPELPSPSSSLSYWHRTTRAFPHLNSNSRENVPPSTRYVIIGSGVSGALTAWKLIESGVPGRDIVILEAREAVGGATGRNAGHVRPDAFRGFPHFAALHGPEQALQILRNERVVLENAKNFVAENRVDCEFQSFSTVEVCLTPSYAAFLAEILESYRAAGGDDSHIKFYEAEEARELTRVPGAVCAYEWPAGSNHPGKLCQWILSDVIKKGARLWTHCPATKVTAHDGQGSSKLRWDVHTPRGTISTETVVHCTNAYAGYLLPHLADFVIPQRSQVHAFVPTQAFSGADVAKRSISLRYGLHNFFSFNPLHNGTIIIGGTGVRNAEDFNPDVLKRWTTFDDSGYEAALAANSTREFLDLSSAGSPARPALRRGEGLDHAWTGILGMTPDSVPFIGQLEGLDGQWICAGFNGHGMARIFTCAPGLVKLMAGEPWEATGLPKCFQFTHERINKFKKPKPESHL
ncbi:unnamed protein product, partial [Clonostachys rhizophaga]